MQPFFWLVSLFGSSVNVAVCVPPVCIEEGIEELIVMSWNAQDVNPLLSTSLETVDILLTSLSDYQLANALDMEQEVDALHSENNLCEAEIAFRVKALEHANAIDFRQKINSMMAEICRGRADFGSGKELTQINHQMVSTYKRLDIMDSSAPPKMQNPFNLEGSIKAALAEVGSTRSEDIVEILANEELQNAMKMQQVADLIIIEALHNPQHSDSYAEIVSALCARFPELPPEDAGGKPVRFWKIFLKTCQDYFDQCVLPTMQGDEHRSLAYVRFVGHLYLRKLYNVRSIKHVIFCFVGSEQGDRRSAERAVSCVCDLLGLVGSALELTIRGQKLLRSVKLRLQPFLHRDQEGTVPLSTATRTKLQKLLTERSEDRLTMSINKLLIHTPGQHQKPSENHVKCSMCVSASVNVVLLPCRHMPLCARCLANLQQTICPTCKAPVLDRFRFF